MISELFTAMSAMQGTPMSGQMSTGGQGTPAGQIAETVGQLAEKPSEEATALGFLTSGTMSPVMSGSTESKLPLYIALAVIGYLLLRKK